MPETSAANRVDIWLARLDLDQIQVAEYASLLSSDECLRMLRFKLERKRNEYAITRGLLRRQISRTLACGPDDIVFAYGEHGKPELASPQAPDQLSFNATHSHDLALVALSSCRKLGADIEKIRGDVDCHRLAKRFFSAREARELRDYTGPALFERFFACWTRKEALVKALGKGIAFGLADFSVDLDPAASLVGMQSNHPDLACGYRLYSIRPAESYIAAVAVLHDRPVEMQLHKAVQRLME